MPEPTDHELLVLLLQRVSALEIYLHDKLDDHETRLRTLEVSMSTNQAAILRLADRVTGWQVFQAALTAMGSSIAGWFGRQP